MAFPRVENAPKAKIYGNWSTGAAAAPLREPRSGEKRRQRAGMRSMGGKDAEPAGGSGAHLPALGQGRRPAPKIVGIGAVGAQRGPREHQKWQKRGPGGQLGAAMEGKWQESMEKQEKLEKCIKKKGKIA